MERSSSGNVLEEEPAMETLKMLATVLDLSAGGVSTIASILHLRLALELRRNRRER